MGKRKKTPPRRELADLRVRNGFSQAKFADQMGVTLNAVRHWEQGLSVPMPRYRPVMAQVLGVSLTEIDRLIDGRSHTLDSHIVAPDLSHYESLVQGADRLAQVETVAIPGLFQTMAYAMAVERFGDLPRSEEQMLAQVERRIARQAVLHRKRAPLTVEALVAEQVLTSIVGNSHVMVEQYDRVLDLTEYPNVNVRVLPSDGRQITARGGFQLFTRPNSVRPFLAAEFSASGPTYEERPAVVGTLDRLYQHLCSISLTPSETICRIRDIREETR
jgi:transcriptional regulator with XRE-family HTH domain